MTIGVHEVAVEFAKSNNLIFKAANACGDAWVLKIGQIDEDSAKEAFKENVELGGTIINKQAWKANRQYFNSI